MGSSQPFIPVLKDIPPPSRGLSSSIWAPQPHPTEASWQQAITSFSQSAEEKVRSMPDDRRGPAFGRPDRDGDVFGPVDFFQADHKKNVGAIGDGRKKTSPDPVNNVGSARISHTAVGLCFDSRTLNSSSVPLISTPLFRLRILRLLACLTIPHLIYLPFLRHLRC